MKIFYICRHAPTVIDPSKASSLPGCTVCGEKRIASTLVRPPSFTAMGVSARGPLVKGL